MNSNKEGGAVIDLSQDDLSRAAERRHQTLSWAGPRQEVPPRPDLTTFTPSMDLVLKGLASRRRGTLRCVTPNARDHASEVEATAYLANLQALFVFHYHAFGLAPI